MLIMQAVLHCAYSLGHSQKARSLDLVAGIWGHRWRLVLSLGAHSPRPGPLVRQAAAGESGVISHKCHTLRHSGAFHSCCPRGVVCVSSGQVAVTGWPSPLTWCLLVGHAQLLLQVVQRSACAALLAAVPAPVRWGVHIARCQQEIVCPCLQWTPGS